MSKAVSVLLVVLLAMAMPYAVAAQCGVAAMHASAAAADCAKPCCPAHRAPAPVRQRDGHGAVCASQCDALLPAVFEVAVAPVRAGMPAMGGFAGQLPARVFARVDAAFAGGWNDRGRDARSSVVSPLRI